MNVEAIRRISKLLNSTRTCQIVVGAENGRRKFGRDLESEHYRTIVLTPGRSEGDDMSGDINSTAPCAAWKIEDPSTFFLQVDEGGRGEGGSVGHSPVTGGLGL